MKNKILHTLLLNADGSPFNSLPLTTYHWQDAIRLYFLGKVSVIENYSDWKIHSEKFQMNVPSVIMLKEYHYVKHKTDFNRENVFLRDDYICQYCGNDFVDNKKLLSLDHVIPSAKGGKTNFNNIVTCCTKCNLAKGDKIIKPNKKPKVPTYYQLLEKRIDYPITVPHESWKNYLPWEDKDLIFVKKRKVKNYAKL